MIVSGTPWEKYDVDGVTVHVKREDLCCPYPGPMFSKMRGVEAALARYSRGMFPPNAVGVVDSVHSKAGWGVSWICSQLGLPCVVFYPKLKAEGPELRPFQQLAEKNGARLVALPATKSAVLWYQARKLFRAEYPEGVLLPNGLSLPESIRATAQELIHHTPSELIGGTWVVSVSSGTIAAGVCEGLRRAGFRGELIFHCGYSRSEAQLRKDAAAYGFGREIAGRVVDEGYAYKDAVDTPVPFPCNPYYDRKAWKWLVENIRTLPEPVVFWNIGA